MAEFLEQRCRTLEAMDVAMAAYAPGAHVGRRRGANNSRSSFIVTNSLPSTCALCGGWSHIMSACRRFLSMPPEIRLGEARRLGLCRKCLQTGHHMRECLAASCRSCGRRHHSLLHFLEPQASSGQPLVGPPTSAIAEVAEPVASSPSTANALVAQGRSGDISLLATANIFVRSCAGSLVPCRALLDSGSQVHVITSRLASQLQLRRYKSFMAVSGIGDTGFATDGFSVDVLLRSHCSEYSTLVNAVIAANITDLQPSFSLDVSSWNIPGGLPDIPLADPNFFESSQVDVRCPPSILLGNAKPNICGALLGQETIFGWVLTGPLSPANPRSVSVFSTRVAPSLGDSLDQLLTKFWEVEDVPTPISSESDSVCEHNFVQTTKRDECGKYVVTLPLRDPGQKGSELAASRSFALAQFLRNEQRLKRDPPLKARYDSVIQEYIDLGHMTEVSPASNSATYHLPHHAVFKPESTTTKVRVVFNASSPSANGTSLNDILYAGPVLQSDLTIQILKWRYFRFVFNADIEKMYRQIWVDPKHTPLQRILFRNPDGDIRDYELKTVTFGVNCAPFLAIRVLRQLADDEESKYPQAS
ncbi:hypothetical protein KR074_011099, partial [Drosophila pseudoananassae]